jgi:hypothetical protein
VSGPGRFAFAAGGKGISVKGLVWMQPNRVYLLFGAILIAYFALTITTAVTKTPWSDEASFASPAYNLSHHGYMGTSTQDADRMKNRLDKYTYWVMPFEPFLYSGWYQIVGFGVFQMRILTILFGALGLCGWMITANHLTGNVKLALFTMAMIALDYHYALHAADGRMDMMCAGLGSAGLAVYLLLRQSRFLLAITVANCFIAAAVYTHPNGALYALVWLTMALMLDWRRASLSAVACTAFGYVVGGAMWGVYIAKDPHEFLNQFVANASGRGPTLLTDPLGAIRVELSHRYMDHYGWGAWSHGLGRINIVVPMLFAAGLLACLLSKRLRQSPGIGVALACTTVALLVELFLDGTKQPTYLIHVIPWYWMLISAVVFYSAPPWRMVAACAAVGVALLQVSKTIELAARTDYWSDWLPTMQWLSQHGSPDRLIMGSPEIAFAVGFDWKIQDDDHLGFETGKRPEFIVLGPRYRGSLPESKPEIYQYATKLMETEYREAFRHGAYLILERK